MKVLLNHVPGFPKNSILPSPAQKILAADKQPAVITSEMRAQITEFLEDRDRGLYSVQDTISRIGRLMKQNCFKPIDLSQIDKSQIAAPKRYNKR